MRSEFLWSEPIGFTHSNPHGRKARDDQKWKADHREQKPPQYEVREIAGDQVDPIAI
jgi:hypothetical protein